MSNVSGFGTPDLDNTNNGFKGTRTTWMKLKTPDRSKGEEITEVICRIVPPVHSCATTGKWHVYHSKHFGFYSTNPKNPDKPRARLFGCIKRTGKNKEVYQDCPQCLVYDAKKSEYDSLKSRLEEEGLSQSEVRKQTDSLYQWIRKFGPDRKEHVNVMLLDGKFAVLQLTYSFVRDTLEPFLRKLRDDRKILAIDPEKGVWLRFTRTGQNPQVKDSVELYKEVVKLDSGEEVEKTRYAPMSDAQLEQALKLCPDLTKLVTYITEAQIQRLVSSAGDPDVVEAVFAENDKGAASEDTDASVPDALSTDNFAADVVAEVAPLKAAAVVVPAVSAEDEEEAALEAQMKALKARKAQAKNVAMPGTTASADAEAAFLAKFAPKA